MKNKFWWGIVAFFLFTLFSTAHANEIKNIRVSTSNSETRTVIDLAASAEYSYFTLQSPHRLVLDLKNSKNSAKLPKMVTKSPILTKIRKSNPPNSSSFRLVFELKSSVTPKLFTLAPGGSSGHRLVIDFPLSASKQTSVKEPDPTSSKPITKVKSASKMKRDVLIVVDPGHGGKDPGSIGPSRKYEKHVTLSVSKKLVARLNAISGVQARLTRTGDYFVGLDRRIAIADKNRAHLFVSIHADSFTSPRPRGASVFYLNERRTNTEIARWVENHERQSARLGGTTTVTRSDRVVNKTLLDLQFTNSKREGEKLAKEILAELKKVAKLHKSKPAEASLAVLRQPQIPSVLVELGFISNPTEERLLQQRSYQDKLAGALTNAVMNYMRANPPENTYLDSSFASRGSSVYVVKSGDFLSKIASKHGVSVSAIKRANNLYSDTVRVGQKLKIPSSSSSSGSSNVSTNQTKRVTHVVRSGEFLGQIANRYKVSVSAIKRENNLKSDQLRVGQKLNITVAVKEQPLRKHTVKSGEFLGKIAAKYGVTVSSIREANNLRSDELAVGQVLIIPN